MKWIAIFFLQILFFTNHNAQYIIAKEQLQGGACCCGQFVELFFPNLDFESPPSPAPGTFITYGVGQNFGGWTVTRATIDHCDALVGNLGLGNPNGATFFVDLHGSPGFGAIAYDLYGLTPGNQYRIEYWTAQNGGGFSSDGNLKIANGAWLNVSWTVSVDGSVSWRKESYEFMAMGSAATMEFSSTGPFVYQGTLVDDIHIYECPGDAEKPEVLNPPDDLEVECDKDIPKAIKLLVSDNCDPKPVVIFKETTETFDPCTKRITRNWEIKDACGNTSTENQIIDVIDKNPPQFSRLPENKTVTCDKDVTKEFNDWIKKNANALATDACVTVSWRADYDHKPAKSCDTVIVGFIATDHCGNESSEFAQFVVIDTVAPKFIVKAVNKNLVCIPSARDSLRAWLNAYGFSKTNSDCDTVILSSNFNGDSTINPLALTFYSRDRCGNIDSTKAVFSYRSSSDTFRITNYSCSFLQNSSDTMLFNIGGCDSIVILDLIRLNSDSSSIQLNTCDINQRQFDTIKLVNNAGCDSLVFYEYFYHPPTYNTIQQFGCTFVANYNDTIHLQGQFCDSLLITEHILLRKDSSLIIQFTCDPLKTDTIINQFINEVGCDSIVSIYTQFAAQKITFNEQKICGLTTAFTDTVRYNGATCDSLVITTHTPLPLDTIQISGRTCNALQAGIFSTTYKNKYGCDSLVLKTVTLDPSDSTFISTTSCNLVDAGKIIQNLKNIFGCDSIIETTTLFVSADTNRIIRGTCNLVNVRMDTMIFNTSVCDSLVIINYVFIPSDTLRLQKSSCDQTQAGIDTAFFAGVNCDSMVITSTLFIPSDTIRLFNSSCNLLLVGTDTLQLKNSNGCDSIAYIKTDYMPIKLQYDLDSISCFGKNDGRFKILNNSDFAQPLNIYLNQINIADPKILAQLSTGQYEIFVKDDRGCITDTIAFILNEPPKLIVELGNDLEVKKGELVNLNLQSNLKLQQIYWNPSTIGCNNCPVINFNADEEGWIFAIAVDERGCSQTDSIFIRLKRSYTVYAPNSFSPNGDNINDNFYITGPDDAIIISLQIYDRWGEMVFENSGVPVNQPAAGWNGSYKSQKLNPAVFIYYARILVDGSEVILKGDLSLLR
jgi:gliding motility-associated-like protein